MDQASENLQEKLLEALQAAFPDLLAVYRFGSWQTPAERSSSDIDLAVLPACPLDNLGRWEVAQQLALIAGRNVDLVDLLSASTVLRMQVVEGGNRIFCTDEYEVGRFEDMVFSAYARFNYERRKILDDIRKTGTIYGK